MAEIVPILIAAVTLGAVWLLKSRSAASANGTPVSQVNLIPESWSDPLRPLPVRRLLVGAWSSLLIVGNLLVWQGWSVAIFLIQIAWFFGMALAQATRLMSELSADQLDERMVAARNRAFRVAYYTVGGAVLTAMTLAIVLNDGDVAVTRGVLTGAAFSLTVLVAYLPSAILAWTEPVV